MALRLLASTTLPTALPVCYLQDAACIAVQCCKGDSQLLMSPMLDGIASNAISSRHRHNGHQSVCQQGNKP